MPTIVYYDEKGEVVAIGAEALLERVVHESTGGLTKAEWHVHIPLAPDVPFNMCFQV